MARRRRSLLGHKGPSLPTPAPEKAPAAAVASAPEAEPAPAPEEEEPAPEEEEEPAPEDKPAPEEEEEPAPAPEEPAPAPEEEPAAQEDPAPEPEEEPGYEAYARAGMDAALEALGDEPFGSFDELGDPPPTEEVPAGVYEDVSTPYSAPMNVPEPPPIPGIVDRFTPPPVQRTAVGAHQVENRPSYLAEPTPAPAPERRRDFTTYQEELERQRAAEVQEERSVPPVLLLGLGVAVLVLLAAGVGAAASWLGHEEVAQTAPVEPVKRVEVRADMRKQPGLIGADALEGASGGEPLEAGTSEAVEAASPGTTQPAPAPKPAAAPRARAPRKAKPAPPPADVVTLQIRSNQRVLVSVNGQAVGYTPLNHPVPPGRYTIGAVKGGQSDTRQTVEVTVEAGAAVAPVDFTF